MADGTLKFDTKIDLKGMKQGIDNMIAEQENLNAKIEVTTRQLKDMKAAYESQVSWKGADSKEMLAMQKKIVTTEESIRKMIVSSDKLTDKINKQEEAFYSAKQKVEKYGDSLDDTGKKSLTLNANAEKAKNNLKGMFKVGVGTSVAAVTALTGAVVACTEKTREYRQELARLEVNAQQNGTGFDRVKSSLRDLNAITGETSGNVEALSNLMAAGFKDSSLEQAVESLSGAVVKFPDTLKIESLADSLQETMSTGKATGQFAELLKRTGTEIESFESNLRIAAEQGREQNFILETLAKTGLSDVNKAYRENNKALIESANAQFDLNEAMAEVGEVAEPIISEFKGDLAEMIKKHMPQIQKLIESTADKVINLMEFVIDHGPAILSLMSAIGAGMVAMNTATVISGIVQAVRAYKLTVEGATTAQALLNGVMLANPAVAIATAVAALAAGLVVYAATCDSTAKTIKKLNKEMDEARERGKEIISSSEAEIAEVRMKSSVYEDLLDQYKKTGQGYDKLKLAAEELAKVLPEGTSLIDEQTGAYISLGNSIDDVVNKMRAKAKFEANYEEYKTAVNQTEELQKSVEKAQKALDDYYENPPEYVGDFYGAETSGLSRGLGLEKDRDKAKKALEDNQAFIDSCEEQYRDYIDDMSSTSLSYGENVGDYTGAINHSTKKFEEAVAETFKKRQEVLKIRYDRGFIEDKEYYAELEKLLGEYTDNQDGAYRDYFTQIYQYNKNANAKLLSENQRAAEKATAEQERAAKTVTDKWKSGLDKLVDEAGKAFDTIENEKESMSDRLSRSGGLFAIEDDELYIKDIRDQINELKEYQATIDKLREAGASKEFMTEFAGLDMSQANAYAESLFSGDIDQYFKDWEEKQKLAAEISEGFYADEVQTVKEEFSDKIIQQMAELPAEANLLGQQTAKEFTAGIREKLTDWSAIFAKAEAAVYAEQASMARVATAKTMAANPTHFMGSASSVPQETKLEQKIELHTTVELDGDKVGEAVTEYQNEKSYITGRSVFD